MSGAAAAARRFGSPAAGLVAAGRKRLFRLLAGMSVAVAAAAVAAFATGRVAVGVLGLVVAFVPLVVWRLAADSLPEGLELRADRLVVALEGGSVELPLPADEARRLSGEEIAHLASLAERGGIVTGAGSYDSRLLGEIDLYAGDLECAVLLVSGERRLVITPEDPAAFLAAL